MNNRELVDAFIDELLKNPNLVMQAVQLRLSATDYELVLKKADPLKPFEKEWEFDHRPVGTGERNTPGLW